MISQKYPFGFGEIYLKRELRYLSQRFDEIHLYPLNRVNNKRSVPENVFVNEMFCNRSGRVNKWYALKKYFDCKKILKSEIENAVYGVAYLKEKYKEFLAQVIMAQELSDKFYKTILPKIENANVRFYSVWLDEGALVLSLLKRAGRIKSFVVRLHGFDLYDDRREGKYMPFRCFCFKHASKIFVVSQVGADYTKRLNLYPEKVLANYSGVDDHGLTKSSNGKIRLISCSNLIPLKRVNLIIKMLESISIPIEWKHFGDGTERSKLEKLAEALPNQIDYSFEGHVNYDKLISTYTEEHWTCFIHMSESEGLPLSLVEAMSFGIPVIACDVGGVSEIVSEKEGLLLELKPNLEKATKFILRLADDPDFLKSKSEGARLKFLGNFNAQNNYHSFTDYLLNS